ncbi:MAG: gamma-glutamyl-gamma-aminobutyrate hydrolase family protein [Verrucomicrobia bacterium]|nr:gamma-glutamyl-gamma-aminobutyrate hydrolase family protein [Verrucomicrobiota bacterium]
MRERPLILVVPSVQQRGIEFADFSVSLSNHYTRAVIAAGGVPWVMPCCPDKKFVAECVRRAGGVMLTGGDDLEPKLFSKKPLPEKLRATVTLDDPRRDALELAIVDEVFRQRRPLLAICRGAQMLNVALGGGLIVDIPLEVPGALAHRQMDRKNEPVHDVALTPGSLLSSLAATQTLGVNSTHHQAAGRIAKLLRTTARSADGVVEALELKPAEIGRLPWLLAVQFHPERMFEQYPVFGKIFADFVGSCCPPTQKS